MILDIDLRSACVGKRSSYQLDINVDWLLSKFNYSELTAEIGTALSERYTIVGRSRSLITNVEMRNNEQTTEHANAMVQKILQK